MEFRHGGCITPGFVWAIWLAALSFVATTQQTGQSSGSGSLELAAAGQASSHSDSSVWSPISLPEELILGRWESLFRLREPAPSLRSDHRYAAPLETSRLETNELNTNFVCVCARRLQVTTSEIVIHG